MTERQIKLSQTEDVKNFVRAASKCNFDIDVFYNRIVVDAKSILGVFSLDLNRTLTVRCNGSDDKFNQVLDQFAIAKSKESKKRIPCLKSNKGFFFLDL